MNIEILEFSSTLSSTGIGRYVGELYRHLQPLVSVEIKHPRQPRLAKQFSFLKYVPNGIIDHRAGSIVHYPRIMGCAMQLWRPQSPAVATVHDLGVLELPEEWRMFDPVARQLLRLSLTGLKRMDAIVAVSEFTRKGVIRHLGISPNKVVTIHSGIDHQIFYPRPGAFDELIRRYPALAHLSRPWLLYVGSELPRKNLALLVKAIAELKIHFPGIRLLKVGSAGGKQFRKHTLNAIQQQDVGDRVHLFEEVSNEDLLLFYNSADLLVQPSRMEGFSFPVLEAMACGLPVICSSSGALHEIGGDAICLVADQSASTFGRHIREVLENVELRQKMVSNGLKQSGEFCWQKSAHTMVEVYQSLDGNNKPS